MVASYLLGTSVPNFGAPLGIVMVAPAPAPVGPAAWLPGLLEGLDSTLPQDWNRRTTKLKQLNISIVEYSFFPVKDFLG